MPVDERFLDASFSLEGLSGTLATRLAALARTISVPQGKVLFSAGDPGDGLYAVLDGSLKVVLISGDGVEQLLDVLGPGSVVGELALFDGRPRSATVMALKDSTLAFMERVAFDRLAGETPEIYRHMLRIVGRRLRHANDVLAARSFLPLPGRVAQALLQLADSFGRPVDADRTLIHYKVSQAEIASMAGGARENVSRILNEFRRSGVVSRISGYYCIEKRATLVLAASL